MAACPLLRSSFQRCNQDNLLSVAKPAQCKWKRCSPARPLLAGFHERSVTRRVEPGANLLIATLEPERQGDAKSRGDQQNGQERDQDPRRRRIEPRRPSVRGSSLG